MRKEFEMTQADLDALIDASKPTMCIMIGNVPNRTPQENANDAWERLGEKMGFDYMSVQPIPGKDQRFFTAEARKEENATATQP